MREKRETLVITFSSTTAAIRAERLCKQREVPGRLIPVPASITADCGMAWAMPPEGKDTFDAAARDLEIAEYYRLLL